MENRKVLVTGANGFVGRHCLPVLRRTGFSVYAVCRHRPLAPVKDIIYLECDLKDEKETAGIFRKVQPSYLLHLAWYAKPEDYMHSDENLEWVAASIHLARLFLEYGGQRLVTAGSCAEYDWGCIPPDGRLSESAPISYAGTPYASAKASLGSLLGAYLKQHGRSFAHARMFYMFGPGENEKRLVPQAVKSIREGKPFVLRNGAFVRDYLYVKDVASALCRVLDSPLEGPVNVASGKGRSLSELLCEAEKILGASGQICCSDDICNTAEPACFFADVQKLSSVGWKPAFSLSTALQDYISETEE